MNTLRPRRLSHALLPVLVAVVVLAGGWSVESNAAAAPETWTVSGKTYDRVRVLEVTAATVMIAHAGGMVQIDLATLPPELQQRFRYDPAQAELSRLEAASGMAATEAAKREQARLQKQRAELEAIRERVAQRALEADPNYVPLKPEVDLRPVFVEHNLFLKNQGARPSCTIFAVISVLEYEYARRFGANEQLSEEFLIWAMRTSRPGAPINDGYHFREVLDVLHERGVARRSVLPDSFASYQRDENPPETAIEEALSRRTANPIVFDTKDPQLLVRCVQALNQELPVIIGIKWPAPPTIERNNLLKEQVPQSGAGHAVILVGYTSDGTPESLQFVFRNSYGPQWGLGGYGLMAASYLQANVITAFCLVVPQPG